MNEEELSAGRLCAEYGELVGGKDLQRLLGFRNRESFRTAAKTKRLPVAVFRIAGRRGLFARTRDVGQWLDSLALSREGKEVADGLT